MCQSPYREQRVGLPTMIEALGSLSLGRRLALLALFRCTMAPGVLSIWDP